MRFTDELWRSTLPVYEAILAHPFIQELTDGSLSRERFVFYMKQDALYLREFSRALALTGARLPDASAAQAFMGFAHGVFAAERQLHEGYFQEFGVEVDIDMSPSCFAYAQHLLATTATANHYEAGAAVLPCFWVYRDVGKAIVSKAKGSVASNPYARWIEMYSAEGFDDHVNEALDIVEALAQEASIDGRRAMQRAFEKSVRLEWLFWDSAYRLEAWQP